MFGSRGATKADFAATMQLVRDGFVDLTRLISRTYSAQDAASAFQDLDNTLLKSSRQSLSFDRRNMNEMRKERVK